MISREQAVSRVVLNPVSEVRQAQGGDRGTASIWAEWVSSGALGGPCGEGVGKAGLQRERERKSGTKREIKMNDRVKSCFVGGSAGLLFSGLGSSSFLPLLSGQHTVYVL